MQQVNFEVGDRVVKGDTLMVLTRRDLLVKETAARIALKKAQTLQARWEVLHDKKLISDQQLENVRFDAEVAHCNWITAQHGTGQNRNHCAPGRDGGRGQCEAWRLDTGLHRGRAGDRPYEPSGASACVRGHAERDP